MIGNYKIGVQILYFDSEQFILHTIENCAQYVDKIYILYSEVPWTYNEKAREQYSNTSSLDILRESDHYDKIQVLEGIFDSEEEQRNDGLLKAKNDGMDFLIIQDPDEFYLPNDYQANLQVMIDNPGSLYYRSPWYLFWRKKDYVIRFLDVHGKRNTIVNYNPVFGVNCNQDVFFTRNRLLNTTNALFLEKPCYHLSYYVSDDQLLRKINTWGHSSQILNKNKWFRYKWQAWTSNTKNICPFNPKAWPEAVKYSGTLPDEFNKIAAPKQEEVQLSLWQMIDAFWYDLYGYFYFYFDKFRKKLRKRVGKFQ